MVVRRIAAQNSEQPRRKRVAAYCRVSTKQEEQESSMETQVHTYTDMIKSNPEWELAGIYSDSASGLSAEKRPQFKQMIKDALDGKIELILCKSVSRFSRNIVECQRYVEMLKSKNISVHFEKEKLRTDDPTSSFMFSLMCAVAQDESRSISENIKTASRHRVEAGKYVARGHFMLGYGVKDKKLVPNEDAWIVKLIFEMYADGAPIEDICRKLNNDGVTRMRASVGFTHSAVQSILRNETYWGDKKLQKLPPIDFLTKHHDPTVEYISNYLENDHEAIVSREIADKVRKRMQEAETARLGGVKVYGNSHVLYGKIYCSCCGEPYIRRVYKIGHASRDNKVYERVWVCRDRFKGKKGNGCKNRNVKETEILGMLEDKVVPNKIIITEHGIEII